MDAGGSPRVFTIPATTVPDKLSHTRHWPSCKIHRCRRCHCRSCWLWWVDKHAGFYGHPYIIMGRPLCFTLWFLLSFFFFLACCQQSQTGCLPYLCKFQQNRTIVNYAIRPLNQFDLQPQGLLGAFKLITGIISCKGYTSRWRSIDSCNNDGIVMRSFSRIWRLLRRSTFNWMPSRC